MNRPSHKEISGKLRQAKEAVAAGKIVPLNFLSIASDAIELNYLIGEIQGVLAVLLNEIDIDNYAGKRPPEKSYEDKIKGMDLFVFRWMSSRFGCQIYFKFCMKGDTFCLVSLHKNR